MHFALVVQDCKIDEGENRSLLILGVIEVSILEGIV